MLLDQALEMLRAQLNVVEYCSVGMQGAENAVGANVDHAVGVRGEVGYQSVKVYRGFVLEECVSCGFWRWRTYYYYR